MALWILAVVFSLVGVPFILLARRTFAKDRAAAGWPRAPGKIVSSEVLTWNEKRRHDDGYYFDWTASRPAITYTYNVGGLEMEGKRIAREVDQITSSPDYSKKFVDRYPAGKDVLVYYDPSDHANAFLEVQRSTGATILMIFGCVWVAIGALMLALALLV